MTTILETSRLTLRELTTDDAPFMLELLNDDGFIRYIADRGVRTLEQAAAYIRKAALDSYAKNGFGLWLVVEKESGVAAGLCGLIRRDTLPDVDIGYAFLPQFRARGYALESAAAVKEHGMKTLGMKRLLAITNPDNDASIRLLEKIGFRFDRLIRLEGEDHDVRLFTTEPAA